MKTSKSKNNIRTKDNIGLKKAKKMENENVFYRIPTNNGFFQVKESKYLERIEYYKSISIDSKNIKKYVYK
jgi:hypothetical protein